MDMNKIKTGIKRFFSNPNTLTFLLVIVLIVIIYVVYNYMISRAVAPVTVPYCSKKVLSMKEITDEYAFFKFKAKLTFNVNVTDLTTGTLYKAVQGEGVAAVKLFLDDRGNVIKGPVALRSARIVKNGTKYEMVGVDMAVQFTEAAQAAINNCAEQLENMFPLVGYCMGKYNESDKTIKVNLGSNQGLNDGDYLIVIRADEDEDPFTGEKFYETRPIASAQAQGVGDETTNISMINIKENPNRGDFVVSISWKRGN